VERGQQTVSINKNSKIKSKQKREIATAQQLQQHAFLITRNKLKSANHDNIHIKMLHKKRKCQTQNKYTSVMQLNNNATQRN